MTQKIKQYNERTNPNKTISVLFRHFQYILITLSDKMRCKRILYLPKAKIKNSKRSDTKILIIFFVTLELSTQNRICAIRDNLTLSQTIRYNYWEFYQNNPRSSLYKSQFALVPVLLRN